MLQQGCDLVVYSKESGLCEVLDYIIDPVGQLRDTFSILNAEYSDKEQTARLMIKEIDGLKDALFIRTKDPKSLKFEYNKLISEIMKFLVYA